MKRFFSIIIMLLSIVFSSNAQWRVRHIKGDELKGTKDRLMNSFTTKNGDEIAIMNDGTILLYSKNGIFDIRIGDYYGAEAKIGFYEDNKLIKKIVKGFSVSLKNADCAILLGDYDEDKIGDQIINHIKYKGDVRIIMPKFHGSDFDARMTKNPNIRILNN